MRMTITMKVISVFSIIPQDRSDQIKTYLRTVYSNNNVFIVLSFLSSSNSPVLVCVGYIKLEAVPETITASLQGLST